MYLVLFPISLFLSACLLFVIQPMVAKTLLPIFGGTPSVWTVCMLFFQIILLLSYSYAWVLSRLSDSQSWRYIHLAVCCVSLAFFPLFFSPAVHDGSPEMQILKLLGIQLGLPLLVIGASAPLLQYGYSQVKGMNNKDPYFLYAASNAGSLIALLAYPFLVERLANVNQQFFTWNGLYLIYLVFLVMILWLFRYQTNESPREKAGSIHRLEKGTWIFLSFIPCSLMLGVTFFITTDVAATPLFWVLPLSLYLLSFVISFANKPLISHAWVVRNVLLFVTFPVLSFIFGIHTVSAWLLILTHLICFFMLALLCHGELARTRPPVSHLTTFYFCLALGGVLAGIFNGLLAPIWFTHAYEYPLVLLLALLCIPMKQKKTQWLLLFSVLFLMVLHYFFSNVSWMQPFAQFNALGVLALTLLLVCAQSRLSLFFGMVFIFAYLFVPWLKPTDILTQQRNFYGIKQVTSGANYHALMSNNTLHGFQIIGSNQSLDGGLAYYGAIKPVVQMLQKNRDSLHAMVMGLGTGIMSCQFREQDHLTFAEVDKQVIAIANNSDYFSFLRDCPPKLEIIEQDGRVAVSHAKDAQYDILVLDAFNSDSIPVHLLTSEAFQLYQQKLAPEGVIAVNVSNRHLRLLPVLTAFAREQDMIVLHLHQAVRESLGQLASEWVLLTQNEELTMHIMQHGWRFVTEPEMVRWTDNYSNIVTLLRW